jgi:hypothetical protein
MSNPAPSNSSAFAPSFSAGGDFIAFHSSEDNLVTNDSNASSDIFVKVILDEVFQDRFEMSGTLTLQSDR